MSPERWQRIKDVALAAMEQEEDQRRQFLDSKCGADSELRRAVEDLLAEDARSGGTIEHGIAAVAAEVQKQPAVAGDEAMIGQTISHYKITEKLGEGGMGVVYKAEDTKLKRMVALKFLPVNELGGEKEKARFLREAQAAASLNHPNICTIYEINEADGRTFIAMEFVDGQTVKDKIASRPQPLEEALDIAIQAALGLRAAHTKEIVHRDIKPANLMLTAEGQVKIMDFGLALPGDGTKLTQTGSTVGTIAYMPPEQCQGQKIDHRADIWSLGVVVYEMVTGQLPFKGDYQQVVAHNILNEDPEPITALRAGLPMELEWIVGKCLAKKADERYQQIEELIVDLRAASKRLAAGKSTVSATPPARAFLDPSEVVVLKRQLRLERTLFVIVTVALLALAVLYVSQAPPDSEHASARRFAYTLPVGFFDGSIPNSSVAVSPNGRHIAFNTAGAQGKLWIQDLDQQVPRIIEGTEGAKGPFWSPDSQFIGFAAGWELKRVSVQGGPVSRVCQMPTDFFFGGAWSPDGALILFSGVSPIIGLYEVPVRGGTPNLLTSPTHGPDLLSLGRTAEIHRPQFLPSEAGPRVLLFSVGSKADSTIVVYDFETGRKEPQGPGANPSYSPSGHIVYQPSYFTDELWALPFSLDTLRATGEAFPISDHAANPTVAVDGTMVYVDGSSSERQLVWLNRAGEKVGEIGHPQEATSYPTLSPGGRFVAVSAVENASRDVWVWDIARPVKTRVNSVSGRRTTPVWSPKGQEVAFTVQWEDGNFGIFRQQADGGGEEKKVVAKHAEWLNDWSQDGRYLLYEQFDVEGGVDLWYAAYNEAGSAWERHPFLETPFNERAGKFSPNGRYVAYLSNESGQYEVYVKPFPRGGPRVTVSSRGGRQPRWSRDGQELFYAERGTLVAVPVSTDASFLAATATRLFEHPSLARASFISQYDVSNDGQRFVLAEPVEPQKTRKVRVVQNWFAEFEDRQRK